MSTFKKEYDVQTSAIITNALVMVADELKEGSEFPPCVYTESAAWDTGAEITIISPRLVETLGLVPHNKGEFMGIGGDQSVSTYMIYNEEVYCSDIDDYDLLIGMDIITQTDFLITNKEGKTTFQFRTPSEGGIEL